MLGITSHNTLLKRKNSINKSTTGCRQSAKVLGQPYRPTESEESQLEHISDTYEPLKGSADVNAPRHRRTPLPLGVKNTQFPPVLTPHEEPPRPIACTIGGPSHPRVSGAASDTHGQASRSGGTGWVSPPRGRSVWQFYRFWSVEEFYPTLHALRQKASAEITTFSRANHPHSIVFQRRVR